MLNSKVGAPKGLTVHWLRLELAGTFLKAYNLRYCKRLHNYRFARYNKRTLIDEFLVVRTSKRCYRVIYFNDEHDFFLYFSSKNYRDCAERMKGIYGIFKFLEEKE